MNCPKPNFCRFCKKDITGQGVKGSRQYCDECKAAKLKACQVKRNTHKEQLCRKCSCSLKDYPHALYFCPGCRSEAKKQKKAETAALRRTPTQRRECLTCLELCLPKSMHSEEQCIVCAGKAYRQQRQKWYESKTCQICQCSITHRSGKARFCEVCAIINQRQLTEKWKRRNPEKEKVRRAALNKNRRARVKGCDSIVSAKDWQVKVNACKGICSYCGSPMTVVTMDHVIPLSRGGLHVIDNVVPCCMPCNQQKGTKLLTEWNPPCQFPPKKPLSETTY